MLVRGENTKKTGGETQAATHQVPTITPNSETLSPRPKCPTEPNKLTRYCALLLRKTPIIDEALDPFVSRYEGITVFTYSYTLLPTERSMLIEAQPKPRLNSRNHSASKQLNSITFALVLPQKSQCSV